MRTDGNANRDGSREGDRDGGGLTVVVNPAAGPALGRDPVAELRDALPAADVVTLDEGDDVEAALEAAAARADVVGVCGGDGTVNTAAGIALAHGKPLVVVPGGTLNHFARDLGLASVADAVDAYRAGSFVEVDVGLICGRPFLNTASFGLYPELVDERERLEGRMGKWPALLVALARVLPNSEPCTVHIDGERRRIWLVFIGNCCYEPAGAAPSARACLDDGRFDVRIVDASVRWARTRVFTAALLRRAKRAAPYEYRTVRELRVESLDGPMRLARDGETFDGPPSIDIVKAPNRLRVAALRA